MHDLRPFGSTDHAELEQVSIRRGTEAIFGLIKARPGGCDACRTSRCCRSPRLTELDSARAGCGPFASPPEITADIIQMIREALNNVRKHANATRVAVTVEKVGKTVEIAVDDNGVGFHFSGAFTLDELDLLRIGPVSLKRRARSLSAELLLDSRPGQGAGLKLKVPI